MPLTRLFSVEATHSLPALLEALAHVGTGVIVDIDLGHFTMDGSRVFVMAVRSTNQLSQLSLLEADRISLVGALAAGFAHEINNPLTSVLLNLRSLRKQLGLHLPETAQPQALR